MSDKIRPVGESKKLVVTLYGNSGIGKTRFIGEGPKTLIIRPPIEHTDSIRAEPKPDEWVVNDWAEMDEVLMYLRSEGGASKYEWVWLDSVTGFQKVGMLDLWDQVIEEKPGRARYGPDKQEYGINMNRLSFWLIHMIGTPGFNFGVTTHPSEVEGLVLPGEVLIGPWVQGRNMAHNMCAMSNVVAYYTFTDKGTRVLRTKLSDDYFAKDQFDAFGESGRLLRPTFPKFLEAIQSSRGSAATKRPRRARRAKSTTKGA